MEVIGIGKEFSRLSKLVLPELSQKELDRLRALKLWQETKDTRLICETFGISRATLYCRRWPFSQLKWTLWISGRCQGCYSNSVRHEM
jgi:hypothetical protein